MDRWAGDLILAWHKIRTLATHRDHGPTCPDQMKGPATARRGHQRAHRASVMPGPQAHPPAMIK
jgi:hypothetical protein